MRSASSYRSSSQPTRADLMQSCRTPTIDSRIKSPRIRASSPNRPNKRRRTASSLNESTTMCASGDVQENDNQATGSDNGAVGRLIGRQRDDAAAAVAMANHSHASHTRRASLQPMSLQQNVTNAFAHPAAKQFNLMQGVQRTQHDTHIRSVSALNPSEDPRMHGNHAISGLPQPTFISADDEQQLANAIPWISGLSTKLLYDTPKGQNASFWGTGPMLGSMTDGSDPGAQHWGR
ncbi:hypothetical protein K437DRAFT_94707 [Tilletiaria anomala UBC 951]|uniref:Uncharacterized protein n=1 Tax=Tilletiaria anomala (strain ATCC 24038 / CBS 436.72 / UBC 951) TaxID=1037660 RepID=A0A066WH81_TILAU|nr:uncharacterized protein K437DRAFT_94707 [Tilletiaria anomala UBC 951]KDN53191.1 hypothetical protein K437DRAFT_94707 [Tilletiaria anomala UBC 951]